MHKNTIHTSKPKAFSLIEVMIGLFVFTMGMLAIFALLSSSLRVSDYNRNALIASQLAVEQIEVLRNIRDTNYATLRAWDMTPDSKRFMEDLLGHHTLSADGIFKKIENFQEGRDTLPGMQDYRLCIDEQVDPRVYRYCNESEDLKLTPFYKYILLEKVSEDDKERLQVSSKVIWFQKGYHEYEIQTLITDWRRL